MDEKNLTYIIENEKEWRRYLIVEVTDIKKDISGLKIKVAAMGGLFGLLGSFVFELLRK